MSTSCVYMGGRREDGAGADTLYIIALHCTPMTEKTDKPAPSSKVKVGTLGELALSMA